MHDVMCCWHHLVPGSVQSFKNTSNPYSHLPNLKQGSAVNRYPHSHFLWHYVTDYSWTDQKNGNMKKHQHDKNLLKLQKVIWRVPWVVSLSQIRNGNNGAPNNRHQILTVSFREKPCASEAGKHMSAQSLGILQWWQPLYKKIQQKYLLKDSCVHNVILPWHIICWSQALPLTASAFWKVIVVTGFVFDTSSTIECVLWKWSMSVGRFPSGRIHY